MKNLLIKEFKLGINAQIIIYASLAILILVPSWPTAISLLYSITGIITLFPRALANRDIEYTVLLPIKKVDVVKGKTLFIMAIEILRESVLPADLPELRCPQRPPMWESCPG